MEQLVDRIIALTGGLDGALHRHQVDEGMVIYCIGAGRGGWDERRAQILFLSDDRLRYFGTVRISSTIDEKVLRRENAPWVVVGWTEETLGPPKIEGTSLLVPFMVHRHEADSCRLLEKRIIVFGLNDPVRQE